MAIKIGNASPDRFNISRFYQGLFNHGKNGKAGSLLKPQNITKLQASTLSTTDRTIANVSARTNYYINRKVEAERVAIQRGNTLEVRTRSNVQDNITVQKHTELNQQSWQLTEGKVNGKNVFSNTQRDLRQVSDETRNTLASENRNGVDLITRNTEKLGNVTRNSIHIDSNNDGNQNVETQVRRKTDTETKLKTYDQNGQLKNSIFNRQAVTQDQKTTMARSWQGEGNRDIEKMTVVTDERNGNVAVRNVNTKTIDNAQGKQTMATNTATETATLIEKLDADGNVLSARNYTQQASTNETRNTLASENRNGVDLLTRKTEKLGNGTRNSTHIESNSDDNLNVETQVCRKTDTETELKTYDQNGLLKNSIFNRQAVTQDQKTMMARSWQSEGNRDIEQMATVTDERKGNVVVRNITTKTIDNAQGKQSMATNTATENATLIENLDADGNVLSARNYSQQSSTSALHTIETNRMFESEQNTHVIARAGEVDTTSKAKQEINASTVDTTKTTGTVQNFDGQGNLLNEQAFERNVTVMTTEDREIENQVRTNVVTQNGATVVITDLKARDDQEIETRFISEQNGQVTQRTIETAARVKTTGEMENQDNAAGVRTLEFQTEQTRESESRDLTIGPAGQGRLVEAETRATQGIEGKLQFNPDTAQVTDAGPKPAVGAIVIDFGTSTGLRSSFKLDNGTLKFDFTASRMFLSGQATTTGQVATKPNGDMTITGNETAQAKGVAEEIHFSGQVVSSVDCEGNRVITLEGNVTDEGIGALFVNNFQGLQSEIGKAEMDINGKLTVNRQTTVEGNQTITKSQAEAEMEINRVENREDMGVNVRTLTPLNATNGFSAGLIADHGALRFNFGVFNFGVSFIG